METTAELSVRAQQYYILSRRWDSDLEFFRIETAFLHRLLDEYFVRLLDPVYFDNLKQTGAKLFVLEKDENELRKQLTAHLKLLELIAENIIPEDTANLTDNQVQIESLVNKLTNEYREVKKDLFALVEGAMKEKKLIVE
jgi:hypothetical protein